MSFRLRRLNTPPNINNQTRQTAHHNFIKRTSSGQECRTEISIRWPRCWRGVFMYIPRESDLILTTKIFLQYHQNSYEKKSVGTMSHLHIRHTRWAHFFTDFLATVTVAIHTLRFWNCRSIRSTKPPLIADSYWNIIHKIQFANDDMGRTIKTERGPLSNSRRFLRLAFMCVALGMNSSRGAHSDGFVVDFVRWVFVLSFFFLLLSFGSVLLFSYMRKERFGFMRFWSGSGFAKWPCCCCRRAA